jgi:hypothetical protein
MLERALVCSNPLPRTNLKAHQNTFHLDLKVQPYAVSTHESFHTCYRFETGMARLNNKLCIAQGFGGHWSATKVGEAAAEIWRVNAWWVSSDPFLKGLKDLVWSWATKKIGDVVQRLGSPLSWLVGARA